MYKSLVSLNCFKYLIYICTVRHKNVQSLVPVEHIMISLYCFHGRFIVCEIFLCVKIDWMFFLVPIRACQVFIEKIIFHYYIK